jgi:hypothetical protein
LAADARRKILDQVFESSEIEEVLAALRAIPTVELSVNVSVPGQSRALVT